MDFSKHPRHCGPGRAKVHGQVTVLQVQKLVQKLIQKLMLIVILVLMLKNVCVP